MCPYADQDSYLKEINASSYPKLKKDTHKAVASSEQTPMCTRVTLLYVLFLCSTWRLKRSKRPQAISVTNRAFDCSVGFNRINQNMFCKLQCSFRKAYEIDYYIHNFFDHIDSLWGKSLFFISMVDVVSLFPLLTRSIPSINFFKLILY